MNFKNQIKDAAKSAMKVAIDEVKDAVKDAILKMIFCKIKNKIKELTIKGCEKLRKNFVSKMIKQLRDERGFSREETEMFILGKKVPKKERKVEFVPAI
ncbi:MAG: hypothetical protein RR420_01470 [Anaerovoracaceae bacterium]